jgi:hypothetical protein
MAMNRTIRKPFAHPGKGPRASKHRWYLKWKDMRNRCQNPNHRQYKDYGGRGISVCQAWNDDFWQYVKDIESLGPQPTPQHEVDRIENDGNYELSNVRWATRRTQQQNSRNAHPLTWEGETLSIAAWADRFGVTYEQFWGRAHHYRYDMAKTIASVQKLKKTG